jgi:hypothetical protein
LQTGTRLLISFLAALGAAGAILIAVYPGFMSYDSIRALHEARTAVVGGDYPPFVSYVWRALDAIWPGPALMLFTQNFLLALAFATILSTLRYSGPFVVAGVAMFCVVPPILGPMLVVWKDVGASACLCAAVACFLVADDTAGPRLAIAAGIVLLFAGAAYRLNAITAVVPLLACYSWRRGFTGLARGKAFATGATALAGIAVAVVVVNGYRFPDFERLPPPGNLKNVMIHDLVAMSARTGKSLVPETTPPATTDDQIEYYRRIYDPRHANLVIANDREGRIEKFFHVKNSAVYSAFLAAIRDEPGAYLQHRTTVFRILVGATNGPTFYPTHFGVDPNEEGVTHRPTPFTAAVVGYVRLASFTLLGRPWFYYLLGAGALAFALLRRSTSARSGAVAVAASGAFYLLPLYFVSPAADVRFNHWSIVCALIVVAMALAPRSEPRATRYGSPGSNAVIL